MSGCISCRPIQVPIKPIPIACEYLRHGRVLTRQLSFSRVCNVGVRASMVDSTENSSDFAKRMETAWLISQRGPCVKDPQLGRSEFGLKEQWFIIISDVDLSLLSLQPRPIACSSCDSNGHVECQWCRGTGFFILGDNMLCQVPSRNTSCVICAGKGSKCCADCKGTGFRAKWLEEPPISK